MSRTTISLSDVLLRRIKARAAREGRSMSDLLEDLLRRAFADEERSDYKLELGNWNGSLRPGVEICDRDKLFDLLDGR